MPMVSIAFEFVSDTFGTRFCGLGSLTPMKFSPPLFEEYAEVQVKVRIAGLEARGKATERRMRATTAGLDMMRQFAFTRAVIFG